MITRPDSVRPDTFWLLRARSGKWTWFDYNYVCLLTKTPSHAVQASVVAPESNPHLMVISSQYSVPNSSRHRARVNSVPYCVRIFHLAVLGT